MNNALPEIPTAERYESELLGLLINYPERLGGVVELLEFGNFSERHAPVFKALLAMEDAGVQISLTTVTDELHRAGDLERAGGAAYISQLIDGVPRVMNVAEYAAKIREAAILREAQKITSHIAANAACLEGEQVISKLDDFVCRARGQEESLRRSAVRLSDVAREVCPTLDRMRAGSGTMIGVSTAFPDLDHKTSGLAPGDLWTLAARPSVGKTALGLEMAVNVAEAGHAVAIFSLEMRREALFLRMACRKARVPHEDARGGRLSNDQWSRLVRAVAEIAQLSIWIDDRAGVDAHDLRWRVRNMARRHNVRLVIVDYMQLLRAKGESRYEQVTRVSIELQAAAKELGQISNGTLLAMAQLNRGAAHEEPQLHHLRDSGQIEQDSDSVLMLFDEKKREGGDPNVCTKILKIAKQRNGPTGLVYLRFFPLILGFTSVCNRSDEDDDSVTDQKSAAAGETAQ